MSYPAGATLDFSVQGVVDVDGRVNIGCKSFTPQEIRDVARDLKVTDPPKPKYLKGDVYVGPDGPRWRQEDGRWLDAEGYAQARDDRSAEANMGFTGYRFLIVGGQAVV